MWDKIFRNRNAITIINPHSRKRDQSPNALREERIACEKETDIIGHFCQRGRVRSQTDPSSSQYWYGSNFYGQNFISIIVWQRFDLSLYRFEGNAKPENRTVLKSLRNGLT